MPPVTIREYLKFKAPAGCRDELVYDKSIVSPGPNPLHFEIADNIYQLLSKALDPRYRAAKRINLRFPAASSMPSPDVFVIALDAFYSALRSNAYPDGNRVELAVEVLSSSNRKKAIQSKLDLYQEYGIEAWVVNPKSQTIEVFHHQEVLSFNLKEDKTIPLPASLAEKPLPITRIFDLG
jgi:Uma2 family endonuclease